MNEPNTSPTPITLEEHLNFFDALKAVLDNKRITKAEWENKEIYGWLDTDVLKIHMQDNKDHNWIISEGDLIGTDWIVL